MKTTTRLAREMRAEIQRREVELEALRTALRALSGPSEDPGRESPSRVSRNGRGAEKRPGRIAA
jgi:hypothetical protein